MKITKIETFIVGAEKPTHKKATRPRGRNWLFVKIYTDEGLTGVGEGGGWPIVAAKAIEELSYFLVGEDPFAITHLWLKLYDILHGHGVTGAVRGGAISAIDIALWDIKGKALGVPIYELLGGKVRDSIDVYGHADSVDAAHKLIDRGYRAFKCSASSSLLSELRLAVGPDIDIGVHCHAELTPAAAIQLGRQCEQFQPMFFEDPVLPENIDALAKVAAKVAVPIATGERFATKWAFSELFSRNIVDIVQPETTRLGGITELFKLAAMAESHAIKVAPHDGSVGPIVEMANVHVLASIPNAFYLEHDANDVPWRSEITPGSMPEKDGKIMVPTKPGLGLELDENVAKSKPTLETGDLEYEYRTPEQMQLSRPNH